jgi:hypothetical protein
MATITGDDPAINHLSSQSQVIGTSKLDASDVEMLESKEASRNDASSPSHRTRARLQLVSLCWCLFLAGWNDGSTGPLLPRIQLVYHVSIRMPFRVADVSDSINISLQVGFAVVSLLFVFACAVSQSEYHLRIIISPHVRDSFQEH